MYLVNTILKAKINMTHLNNLKVKWLSFSILGLILIGTGVSVVGEAILQKGNQAPYFWIGTGGLILLNSGIALFGQAVVYRCRINLNKKD